MGHMSARFGLYARKSGIYFNRIVDLSCFTELPITQIQAIKPYEHCQMTRMSERFGLRLF